MAHVISSLSAAQGRLLASVEAHSAAAKTRQQATPKDTSRATTSFRALFPGKATSTALPAAQVCPLDPAHAAAVAADAPEQNTAPTAQSVFGPNPWVANPTGTAPDGSSYNYNPLYFATAATASQVAQMVGGTVVASDQLAPAGTPFVQQQPNQMVRLANGALINAGLVASFYTHGYPQSYIDQLLVNEVRGSTAT